MSDARRRRDDALVSTRERRRAAPEDGQRLGHGALARRVGEP